MSKEYTYSMPQSFLADKSVPVRWRVWAVINGFFIAGKEFWASNDWIGQQIGCHKDSVSQGVKELEDLGMMHSKRTRRSRVIYPGNGEIGDSAYLRPTPAPISDRSERLSISDSNSDKESCGLEDSPQKREVREVDEEPLKRENRTKDKLAVYNLFSSREQPWWRHAHQKKAALALFDLVGMDKLRAGVSLMKEHADDKYCPQAGTPFEYEEQMPGLARYVKRNGL